MLPRHVEGAPDEHLTRIVRVYAYFNSLPEKHSLKSAKKCKFSCNSAGFVVNLRNGETVKDIYFLGGLSARHFLHWVTINAELEFLSFETLLRTSVMAPEAVHGKVLLGTGPPTREELLVYYPAKFTWEQLKCFVNSGDLGLLKRDKKLQKRYNAWAEGIKKKYGSIVNYLLNYRLQWGQPDTLSLLRSALDESMPTQGTRELLDPSVSRPLPLIPPDAPLYFAADTPKEFISIIQNDWPYSVPPEVEHTLIWTRLPVFHPDLISSSIAARVEQDGLWGFTGTTTLPPSPSLLPTYLPALSEWGITIDKLIRSAKGTDEEEALVKRAGSHIDAFVRQRWVEDEWETAWFVNPPRLQSVLGLAHIHVFARHK